MASGGTLAEVRRAGKGKFTGPLRFAQAEEAVRRRDCIGHRELARLHPQHAHDVRPRLRAQVGRDLQDEARRVERPREAELAGTGQEAQGRGRVPGEGPEARYENVLGPGAGSRVAAQCAGTVEIAGEQRVAGRVHRHAETEVAAQVAPARLLRKGKRAVGVQARQEGVIRITHAHQGV